MKYVLLHSVFIFTFVGTIFSEAVVFNGEKYLTIADSKNFLNEPNYNLIRLYKKNFRQENKEPNVLLVDYSQTLIENLIDLQKIEQQQSAVKVITDQRNKEYFYSTFSKEVDKYLGEATVDCVENGKIFNIPGEIIYFDEITKQPCEIDIGVFQYKMNNDKKCLQRLFKLHHQVYLFEKNNDENSDEGWFCFNFQRNSVKKYAKKNDKKSFYYLKHIKLNDPSLDNKTRSILDQQCPETVFFFSDVWCQEIYDILKKYISITKIDFV
jgi:hypothetical protein